MVGSFILNPPLSNFITSLCLTKFLKRSGYGTGDWSDYNGYQTPDGVDMNSVSLCLVCLSVPLSFSSIFLNLWRECFSCLSSGLWICSVSLLSSNKPCSTGWRRWAAVWSSAAVPVSCLFSLWTFCYPYPGRSRCKQSWWCEDATWGKQECCICCWYG